MTEILKLQLLRNSGEIEEDAPVSSVSNFYHGCIVPE